MRRSKPTTIADNSAALGPAAAMDDRRQNDDGDARGIKPAISSTANPPARIKTQPATWSACCKESRRSRAARQDLHGQQDAQPKRTRQKCDEMDGGGNQPVTSRQEGRPVWPLAT